MIDRPFAFVLMFLMLVAGASLCYGYTHPDGFFVVLGWAFVVMALIVPTVEWWREDGRQAIARRLAPESFLPFDERP